MISKKFLASLTCALIVILLIGCLLQAKFGDLSIIASQDNAIAILVMGFFLFTGIYNSINAHGLKKSLTQISAWCAIVLTVVAVYAFRFEMRYAYNRVLSALIPSYVWHNDEGQIVLSRSNDGHFYINALVNDVNIKFMVDTGASDVALTKLDAEKLKFNLSTLRYSRRYSTANGISFAAPVTLNKFAIGNYIFKNVSAHIGQGELDTSLLGMSLIARFASFRIDNDLLILTMHKGK
jgi:aspartyl protease family protein